MLIVAGGGRLVDDARPVAVADRQRADCIEFASIDRGAAAGVARADTNKEDYFADGLTEDIISALGRFPEFVVRSRNAVFAYKGKTPRPDEVGRDLDVRYIVEGSIRRSPERIRISIRLTDASRGALAVVGKLRCRTERYFFGAGRNHAAHRGNAGQPSDQSGAGQGRDQAA